MNEATRRKAAEVVSLIDQYIDAKLEMGCYTHYSDNGYYQAESQVKKLREKLTVALEQQGNT